MLRANFAQATHGCRAHGGYVSVCPYAFYFRSFLPDHQTEISAYGYFLMLDPKLSIMFLLGILSLAGQYCCCTGIYLGENKSKKYVFITMYGMRYGSLEKRDNAQSKEDDNLDFVGLSTWKFGARRSFRSIFRQPFFHWIRIKFLSPIQKVINKSNT